MIQANEQHTHNWPQNTNNPWPKCKPTTIKDLKQIINQLPDNHQITLTITIPNNEKQTLGLKDQNHHGEIVINNIALNTNNQTLLIGAWLPQKQP